MDKIICNQLDALIEKMTKELLRIHDEIDRKRFELKECDLAIAKLEAENGATIQ